MSSESLSWLRWVLRACIGAAILLIAVYLIVGHWLGGSEAAWALLHGEEIVVTPATVDLGDCSPGDVKELQFRVVNMSSSPVTLTGIYTSCSCILATSLPVTLEARGASSVRMRLHSSGDQGEFTRHAVLYTNSHVSPQLPIVVFGRIIERDDNSNVEPTPQPAIVPQRSSGKLGLHTAINDVSSLRESDMNSPPNPQ